MLTKNRKVPPHLLLLIFTQILSINAQRIQKKQYLCTEIRFANSTLQNHSLPSLPWIQKKSNNNIIIHQLKHLKKSWKKQDSTFS